MKDFFLRLAERFSTSAGFKDKGELLRYELSSLMEVCGKAVYQIVITGAFGSENVPVRFKQLPSRLIMCTDRQNQPVSKLENFWGDYWWRFICWYSTQFPFTTIILPMELRFYSASLPWGDFENEVLPSICKFYHIKTELAKVCLWCRIASVSAEACKAISIELAQMQNEQTCEMSKLEKPICLLDPDTQTIIYKGIAEKIGGPKQWSIIKILYDANGSTVPTKLIEEATGRGDINVFIGEIKKMLYSKNLQAFADAIRNQRLVGYYLDITKLNNNLCQ